MKVYCTMQPNELDEFIGEDIWVKAKVRFDRSDVDYGFIRVLSKDDDGYTINWLSLRSVSRGGVCHCHEGYKNNKLNCTFTIDEYRITLFKPLDCVSTDELFITDKEL